MKNQALIDIRKQLGLNCSSFARLLDIHSSGLIGYEHGRNEPTYSVWLKMKRNAQRNGIDLPDSIFCDFAKKEWINASKEIRHVVHSLREAREVLGLTQKEMGAVMGVTENGYARYERGEREPLVSAWITMKTYARYYGVLVEEVDDAEGCL